MTLFSPNSLFFSLRLVRFWLKQPTIEILRSRVFCYFQLKVFKILVALKTLNCQSLVLHSLKYEGTCVLILKQAEFIFTSYLVRFFINAGNLCEFLVKNFLLVSFKSWLQNKAKFGASKVPNERFYAFIWSSLFY